MAIDFHINSIFIHPDFCPRCCLPNKEKLPFCKCGFDLLYGQIKKPKSAFCAFCEKYKKMSREHFFPDWLKNIYPQRFTDPRFTDTAHIIARPESYGSLKNQNFHYGKGINHKKGNPYTMVVGNVCNDCNNGWMSSLQNEVKIIVTQFTNGEWPDLNLSQRTILARWCAMTTMNIQYIGNIINIPQFQRTNLMNGEMPGGWLISLGKVNDEDAPGSNGHRVMNIHFEDKSIEPLPPLPVQSTYFCIEKVVFFCFSTVEDSMLQFARECNFVYSPAKFGLRTIWPDDGNNITEFPTLNIKSFNDVQNSFLNV